MCKDGKCQKFVGQTRNVVVSLGIAARDLAKLAEHPQMVVKTATHVALVAADPVLHDAPGFTVIMEVYPTTSDAEVAQKADRYMAEPPRRVPPLIRMLEALFGLPPAFAPTDGLAAGVPTT